MQISVSNGNVKLCSDVTVMTVVIGNCSLLNALLHLKTRIFWIIQTSYSGHEICTHFLEKDLYKKLNLNTWL